MPPEHEVPIRCTVDRFYGRYTVTVKAAGATIFVDHFEDFCEMDKRMRGRLGILWASFRDEARARCDR